MSIVRGGDLELTGADLARAAGLFGLGELQRVGGFENALYRSDEGRIVRLTHTSRRSAGMIEAEFAFMDHLARQGVWVPAPVRSTGGTLVEELITDGGQPLVVACMTEAPGGRRRGPEWTPADIETYGALLASMHVAAQSLDRPSGDRRRPDWTDPIFDVGLGAEAETHPELFARNREVISAAAAHPAGATDLLIHQDAHPGNLFITDDGRITIFDFDDCAYGTPTHDVAIVLFYWLLGVADPKPEARRFLTHFLRGYERHARLPSDWPEGADRFLSYREIDIYWLISIEPEDESSPAELRFMEGRLGRILAGVPYLGVPLAEVV